MEGAVVVAEAVQHRLGLELMLVCDWNKNGNIRSFLTRDVLHLWGEKVYCQTSRELYSSSTKFESIRGLKTYSNHKGLCIGTSFPDKRKTPTPHKGVTDNAAAQSTMPQLLWGRLSPRASHTNKSCLCVHGCSRAGSINGSSEEIFYRFSHGDFYQQRSERYSSLSGRPIPFHNEEAIKSPLEWFKYNLTRGACSLKNRYKQSSMCCFV